MTKAVDKGLKCSYRGLLEALGTRAQGSYTGIDLAATFILRSALSWFDTDTISLPPALSQSRSRGCEIILIL